MKPTKLIIIVLLIYLNPIKAQQTFICQMSWRSDGNYYDVNKCIQLCTYANSYQKVQNLAEQSKKCCEPVCIDQVSYHTGKRTAIIVVCSVLLFFVMVCCVFGCFGPGIKKRYVLYEEGKSRKRVKAGCTVDQFDRYLSEFQAIFTEEERDHWQMYSVVDDQKIVMQWFSLQMKKVKNYHYKYVLLGQDMYGSFKINGYYVNTAKGPTNWGVKNFDNAQNSSIYFQKQSSIIHQVSRLENGDYEGIWYNRNNLSRTGKCAIKRKGEFLKSHENIDHFQIVSS